jgi:aldehyde:ferredoxin oxidoreductase
MDSVMGRLATVDLSKEKTSVEKILDDDFRKFLGGNGLAIKFFVDKMGPGIDAFSPENILFLGTGPINGTGVQGSDRTYLAAKSPLTGLFFDCTLGGRFASCIKQNGYDAIAIKGKAKEPSYIWVGENSIEIREARDLIGKSPEEVRSILSTEFKDIEVCAIGIAGENLVKYASIVHPRPNVRGGVAGRGGLGAVMGSKNIKAVVVQRTKGKEIKAHSDVLIREMKNKIQTNLNEKTKHLTSLGTAFGINVINSLGGLGTRNLADETFEYAREISGDKLKDQYYRKNIACNSCPVACGKLCELDGKLIKNPEYETLYALGSMLGIGNIEAIMRANVLCDEFGLDTISLGVTLAFAIECFEKGLLSLQQSANRSLKFGDGKLLLDLVEEIAYRRGLGNLLAEGTKRMSDKLGGDSWKSAYQIKGLEVAGHSPRVVKTLSIGYATNTRGGSHMDARVRYGPGMETYDGKVELAITTQNLSTIGDSLVQCRFITEQGLGPAINDEFGNLLKAVTGWGPSTSELNEVAERIINLERLFNIREGISRKDDTLPYKVMWEEIATGPHKGQRILPEKLEELLDSYYDKRGWDRNGIPSRERLEHLGLSEYVT